MRTNERTLIRTTEKAPTLNNDFYAFILRALLSWKATVKIVCSAKWHFDIFHSLFILFPHRLSFSPVEFVRRIHYCCIDDWRNRIYSINKLWIETFFFCSFFAFSLQLGFGDVFDFISFFFMPTFPLRSFVNQVNRLFGTLPIDSILSLSVHLYKSIVYE